MTKNENSENRLEVKIILIGETGVGKTSLINVTEGNPFQQEVASTFSNSYIKKNYDINSHKYQVNLWDTCGQERYRYLTKLFYKGSDIVIFVYDITSKNSFDCLNDWIKEVKEVIDTKYICGMVGNKKDLYYDEQIKAEEAKKLAENNNMKFKYVSAKDDPISFDDFIKELLRDAKDNLEEKRKNITLQSKDKKKNKCGC